MTAATFDTRMFPAFTAVAIPHNATFREEMSRSLVWLPEYGMGFCPRSANQTLYNKEYWQEYERRALTEAGAKLNEIRQSLVYRYIGNGELIDVGIGAGAFIEGRKADLATSNARTFGFDVNPIGEAWLRERGIFGNPYSQKFPAATFWDVLEHIHDPSAALVNIEQYAFISLPIFTGDEHILRSRHYKPGEHIWYWTRDGLIRWMRAQSFECVEHNTAESLAGREDVHTFVFRRTT